MKRTFVILGLLPIVLLTAPAAQASCVFLDDYRGQVEASQIVFVGTVTETSNRGRNATVAVEEVWKGSGIPEVVEIRGGAQGENVASSVDRYYEAGTRYLFAPYEVSPKNVYLDNGCTPTRPFHQRLDRFRPDDATVYGAGSPTPTEAPAPGVPGPAADDDGLPWIPVGVGVVVLGAVATVVARARS